MTATTALTYQERKEQGICTRSGCRRVASDDSSMCARHAKKYRKLAAESMARKRASREAVGLCVECWGKNPRKATPGSTACLECRIRRRRIKISEAGVSLDVYLQRREEMIAGATRTHADGRTRFHGQQKRGQQPVWKLNVQDLKHAREAFEAFSEGIMMLATPEAQQRHKSDRRSAELEVANVGSRMVRRSGDIIERLGGQRRQSADADDRADSSWSYDKPGDAAGVARDANVGDFVYSPPIESTGKTPDMGPLQNALATRGLALKSEGAFYWAVVSSGKASSE